MSAPPIIKVEGLARQFENPGGKGETEIFGDLWLDVQEGEFICLIGHSGCGKTTLLNILAGLDSGSRGVVLVVRVLHAVWAVAGLAVSGWLFTLRGGHPPGIIFLPIALAAWGLGHFFLWGSGRLAEAGVRRFEARGIATAWPPALLLAIAGTGVVAIGGLALVGRLVIDSDAALDVWNSILLGVWLPHAVCFPALLLRRGWSRWLAAALAAGWAVLLVTQIFTTNDPRPWDLPLVVVLVGALLVLAARLIASERVRRAL